MTARLSSRYAENLVRVLGMYMNGEFRVIEGNFRCGVCCSKNKGTIAAFVFHSPVSVGYDYYHTECLESLLDPLNYKEFFVEASERFRKLSEKVSILDS